MTEWLKQRYYLLGRSAVVLLLCSVGFLSTSLTLLVVEAQTCGMSCCVQMKWCCCKAAKGFDSSQSPGHETQIRSTQLSQMCPQPCPGASSSARQMWSAPVMAPVRVSAPAQTAFTGGSRDHLFTWAPLLHCAERAPPTA